MATFKISSSSSSIIKERNIVRFNKLSRAAKNKKKNKQTNKKPGDWTPLVTGQGRG
jgi:hypothetical protein